jgi:hypothetical protein
MHSGMLVLVRVEGSGAILSGLLMGGFGHVLEAKLLSGCIMRNGGLVQSQCQRQSGRRGACYQGDWMVAGRWASERAQRWRSGRVCGTEESIRVWIILD